MDKMLFGSKNGNLQSWKERGFGIVDGEINRFELLARVEESPPKLMILDYSTSDAQGIETVKTLLQYFPSLKILALAVNSQQMAAETLALGGKGIVLKGGTAEEVESAIQAVTRGATLVAKERNCIVFKAPLKLRAWRYWVGYEVLNSWTTLTPAHFPDTKAFIRSMYLDQNLGSCLLLKILESSATQVPLRQKIDEFIKEHSAETVEAVLECEKNASRWFSEKTLEPEHSPSCIDQIRINSSRIRKQVLKVASSVNLSVIGPQQLNLWLIEAIASLEEIAEQFKQEKEIEKEREISARRLYRSSLESQDLAAALQDLRISYSAAIGQEIHGEAHQIVSDVLEEWRPLKESVMQCDTFLFDLQKHYLEEAQSLISTEVVTCVSLLNNRESLRNYMRRTIQEYLQERVSQEAPSLLKNFESWIHLPITAWAGPLNRGLLTKAIFNQKFLSSINELALTSYCEFIELAFLD